MFDLKIIRRISDIHERNSGKCLQLNRVVINDNKLEQWDLAFWRNGERLGGVLMFDGELEKLKQVINEL